MGDVLFNNFGTADEFVSKQWYLVLTEARIRGWQGDVSEGRRTLQRQKFFWDCMRCCCCNNCNKAAFPSPFAPHIRVGRADHAIDVTDEQTLQDILSDMGIRSSNPVAGEAWHLEANAGDLKRVATKLRDRTAVVLAPLPRHIERHAKKFLTSKRAVVLEEQNGGCGPKCDKKKRFRAHMRAVVTLDLRRTERNLLKSRPKDRQRINRNIAVLRRVLADRDGVLTPGQTGGK